VALQLIRAGYNQVSVVRGGFQGLMDAGVAIAPKPEGAPAASAPEAAVQGPAPAAIHP
jgi:hypothetical protein